MSTSDFHPDPARARAASHAIGGRLADSICHLATTCADLDADETTELTGLADRLRALPRIPPVLFLRYHDALCAVRQGDGAALAVALRSLAAPLPATDGTMAFPIVRAVDDASLDAADWARLRHHLGRVPGGAPQLAAPSAPEIVMAGALLAEAVHVIGLADADLAGEISALVSEIVLARPAPGIEEGFGSATMFAAWGAALLNVHRHADLVSMAGGLAHEAAHSLLMSRSAGAPMVQNDMAERYASPLRAGARPMDGVFHAAFVSARITYAMDRLLAAGVLERAQTATAAQRGQDSARAFWAGHATVAAHAKPTPEGQRAMAGALAYMRAHHASGASF